MGSFLKFLYPFLIFGTIICHEKVTNNVNGNDGSLFEPEHDWKEVEPGIKNYLTSAKLL